MLSLYEPEELVTIASSSSLTGLSQATSQFAQVPVGRQRFDDTKVTVCSGLQVIDQGATTLP